jgi:hypothetical protein
VVEGDADREDDSSNNHMFEDKPYEKKQKQKIGLCTPTDDTRVGHSSDPGTE